jgi:hypothetical protein
LALKRRFTIPPLFWLVALPASVAFLWLTLHPGRPVLGAVVAISIGLTSFLFTAWSFYRMVPRTVALRAIAPAESCPVLRARVAALEKLGFRTAVGPVRYNSRPPSQLTLLAHDTEPVYAAVLRVRVLGLRKVHYSLLSPIVGETGHMESTATPELVAVRAPAWVRFQVIPRAAPDELLRRHLAALARLRDEGMEFAVPAASELEREAIFSLAQTGEYLRANAYRLAAGVYAHAFDRRPRNRPLFPDASPTGTPAAP